MIKNIALTLASVIFSLLLIEVMLQIHNPFPFRMKGNSVVLPQYYKFEISNDHLGGLDKVIHHSKNSIGFRGPEPLPADQSAEALKLLTIGGSTTECYYLSDGEDWPALLTDQLKTRTEAPLWFNNGGLDGHSTFGHQMLLQDVLEDKIHPDVILFLIGINDVALSTIRGNDKRLIPELKFNTIGNFFRSTIAYSEVAALGINLYRSYKTSKIGIGHGGGTPVRDQDNQLLGEPFSSDAPLKADQTVAYHQQFQDAYAERIKALATLSKAKGALPVFMTQPMLVGPAIDPVTGKDLATITTTILDKQGEPGLRVWQKMEVYNNTLRQTAAAEGLPLIDLAQIMPKSSAYFYDSVHFTKQGAAEIARLVAPALCRVFSDNNLLHGKTCHALAAE